jgi:glucose-6-phosphate 1-dehydrogenase
VVIEKPFGNSLDSARQPNARILRTLREDQIFRIDHFLGKDTVQSIMAFRFANGLFEPIWNRDRIDHVQITVAETVGMEQRGEFYEAAGALRDMVPNHVLSLLSLVAMEPPRASTPLRSAPRRPMSSRQYPRSGRHGRCAAGTVLGKKVKAYRQQPKVARDANTETYVAMRFEIDDWRRAGPSMSVPASTCRYGIRKSRSASSRHPMRRSGTRRSIACGPTGWCCASRRTRASLSKFEVKRRGPAVDLAAVKMDFRYDDWFPKEPNVGYETLIHDVMIGDPTLFMRADMVEQGWRIVQPVLDIWAKQKAISPTTTQAAAARRQPTSYWPATGIGPGGRSVRRRSRSREMS